MPMTPMGVATRAMSSPLGRCPTRQFAAHVDRAVSRSIPNSSRCLRRVSRSAPSGPAWRRWTRSLVRDLRVGGEEFSPARAAQRCRRNAAALSFGCRWRLRARPLAASRAARARTFRSRQSSMMFDGALTIVTRCRSGRDRRDGSSRHGRDSRGWLRFRRCACPQCARRR